MTARRRTAGWMGSGAMDILDPAVQNLPQIIFEKEQLGKAGYDPKTSSQFGNGYIYAYPYVEYLRIAAELDGGLNRTNLILAVRVPATSVSPFMLPGVTLKMNGNKDAYMVEASDPGRFVASTQTWSRWATSSTSRARPVCAPGTSRPASASEPLRRRPLTNLHRRLATAASPR